MADLKSSFNWLCVPGTLKVSHCLKESRSPRKAQQVCATSLACRLSPLRPLSLQKGGQQLGSWVALAPEQGGEGL